MESLNTATVLLLVMSMSLHIVVTAASADDKAESPADDTSSYEDYDPEEAVKLQIYLTLQS